MKKHLAILCLASLISFNACQLTPQTFDGEKLGRAAVEYRLSRIDQVLPSGEAVVANAFDYSKEGRIQTFLSPYPYATFFYNADEQIDSIRFGNGTTSEYVKIVWQDGKPNERFQFRDGKLWCKTNFTFRDNRLIKAVRTIYDPSEGIMEHVFEYEYRGNNLSRIIHDGVVASEYRNFDSRPNIYRTFSMDWMQFALDVDTMDLGLSENNCTELLYYGTYHYSFEYTFDTDGKPLERKVNAHGSVEKYRFVIDDSH